MGPKESKKAEEKAGLCRTCGSQIFGSECRTCCCNLDFVRLYCQLDSGNFVSRQRSLSLAENRRETKDELEVEASGRTFGISPSITVVALPFAWHVLCLGGSIDGKLPQ